MNSAVKGVFFLPVGDTHFRGFQSGVLRYRWPVGVDGRAAITGSRQRRQAMRLWPTGTPNR